MVPNQKDRSPQERQNQILWEVNKDLRKNHFRKEKIFKIFWDENETIGTSKKLILPKSELNFLPFVFDVWQICELAGSAGVARRAPISNVGA